MVLDDGKKVAGAAIVEEKDPLGQAPERRGAELIAAGNALADPIGQPRPHVMKREIGEGVEGNLVKRRQIGLGRTQHVRVAQDTANARIGVTSTRRGHDRTEQRLAA